MPRYNAQVDPRPIGRPHAASAAQVTDVERRRRAGQSLRKIALASGFTFSTVRTIVQKKAGSDRSTKANGKLSKLEFDWLGAAEYRRKKKMQDALPKQISELQESGAALVKAAKGLGKA